MKKAPANNHSMSTFSAIDNSQSESLQKVLQPTLYELIALGRVLKQLHWNVVGVHFRALHLHLDEIYATVEEATDLVAERLAAVGQSPNGRLSDVCEHSEIEDVPAGFTLDTEVLLLAEGALLYTVKLIRARIDSIEDVDSASADVLNQIILELEKHHWMLAAQQVSPA